MLYSICLGVAILATIACVSALIYLDVKGK